jgi:hypothetical protein
MTTIAPPMADDSGLGRFAAGHGLTKAASALPKQGNLLSREGQVKDAAAGALPGGEPATLAHYTYSYTITDADNHSHTEHRYFTIVVTRIPESIGFMPSLGFGGTESEMSGFGGAIGEAVQVDLGDYPELHGAHLYRYKGASEIFTRRLVSPALLDWLVRSESDLGFELADGVLCTSRKGFLDDAASLEALCNDASHLTEAIRSESEEEEGSGGADAVAAKDPDADPRVEAALREVQVAPPADVKAATATFRRHVARSPWKPDRVLSGRLPGGGEGALCILGDGSKRADRIAVVTGPAGPVAESGLEAEPQGLTTKDLDTYLDQLAGEDRR